MVKIRVCKTCAWTNDAIRLALDVLVAEHGRDIELVKKDCLDACKREPAVKVGKKLLAPAKPRKLVKRVEKKVKAKTKA